MNIDQINDFIQKNLAQEQLTSVSAVMAAKWLDEAGLLKDSLTRKGRPLRDLLRQGLIRNGWQDKKRHWLIDRME